ncbi:ionotropic receptor 21a-like [Cherax quadricarinatus]|uniref:ionotropic receptor 21a-like n=1 Tax=Cherax quadricarinatus TaxID=27406 RepID=UPI00387E2BE9
MRRPRGSKIIQVALTIYFTFTGLEIPLLAAASLGVKTHGGPSSLASLPPSESFWPQGNTLRSAASEVNETEEGFSNSNAPLPEGVSRRLLQVTDGVALAGVCASLASHTVGGTHLAPQTREVAHLLYQTVSLHLPGCHKVVLYKTNSSGAKNSNQMNPGDRTNPIMKINELDDLVSQLVNNWEEDLMVWDLDTFLAKPPATFYIYKTSHSRVQEEFCVAFVVLADLEGIGAAFSSLREDSWYEGSSKYILAFPGHVVEPYQFISHNVLRTSYNLVVASQVKQDTTGSSSSVSRVSNVYQLLQMCPYCASGNPQLKVAAEWSVTTGFLSDTPLFPNLFKNFQGHQMRVVTLVYEPFSCYHKEGDHLVPADNCVDNNMLREIARSLNFTYIFVEPRDGQWGHRLQNGSYTGVIGAVERMEADFSLNIAITQDREEKVDCTIGYHIEPLTFATTKPRLLNKALALLRPFTYQVWMAFAATLGLAGPFYYIVCTLSSQAAQPDATRHLASPTTVVKASLVVFGACFNQNINWVSERSPRVFLLTFVLTMFVMVTVYVAMLTATLTLPALSPTLNSLEELVQSDFSWGIQDLGAADLQLLKTSQVPLYKRVYEGLKPCPSLDECITKARDTKYAFITWRTYLEDRIAVRFTSATGERQLHVATGDIFPVELGWATNPGCPYRHSFNQKIRALLQSGLVAKWLHDLINDPLRRETDPTQVVTETRSHTFGMNHLQEPHLRDEPHPGMHRCTAITRSHTFGMNHLQVCTAVLP